MPEQLQPQVTIVDWPRKDDVRPSSRLLSPDIYRTLVNSSGIECHCGSIGCLETEVTRGELLAFDMTLSVDGHVPGAHVHPAQEERFEIVSGTMKFRMNGKKIVAGPGDVVTVPAGARHKFSNGGDEPVQVRVEVRPALKMEDLLCNTVALATEGKTNRKGMPKPVHLALFVREYENEVRAPFPPPAVVRALMAPLAAIGRARGHDERYAPAGAPAIKPVPVPA